MPTVFMYESLNISPFPAMQESCTPGIEELVQNAAAACDEHAVEIYDIPFNIESFAINSIAWFSSEW